MRGRGSVRSFEATLRLLLERGHRVHVALDERVKDDLTSPTELVTRIAERFPLLSHGAAPARERGQRSTLLRALRLGIDYLRYLQPGYRDAPKLRARAARHAPGLVRRLADRPLIRTRFGLAAFGRALRLLEAAVPTSPGINRFIRVHRPDLVLVTPLVDLGSAQADYIRSARALGIRTGLCVRSWDNLTNKGLMRDVPDMVAVWNPAMEREAVELHGVPASHVVVTGAPGFDQWFEWGVSAPRAEFCRRVGLRGDRPFLLYVCSSGFIAPEEVNFVRRWIRHLRDRGDPGLRECGVLVRPHPLNTAQWRDVDLSAIGGVALWPPAGAVVADLQSRADYYDSIHHSAAVIGLNTSALIEAAIVGRPVYTLLAPEFRDTQEGTLHFRHLLDVNGGLLHVARSFEEHAVQLAGALASDGRVDERGRRFLEAFVRPHGLDVAATPKLVAAIEAAGASPAPGWRLRPRWAIILRPILALLASYARSCRIARRQQARLGNPRLTGHRREAPRPRQACKHDAEPTRPVRPSSTAQHNPRRRA